MTMRTLLVFVVLVLLPFANAAGSVPTPSSPTATADDPTKILSDIISTVDGLWKGLGHEISDMLHTMEDSGKKNAAYKDMDAACIPKSMHYYRTVTGECNWLGKNHANLGTPGQLFGRDVEPPRFENGYNTPRKGPDARLVSNMFFNNSFMGTKTWNHTAFLPGFVEFLVHDLILSVSGTDKALGDIYKMPVPKCDTVFDPKCTGNKTMEFWRTAAAPGTGYPGAPRQTQNWQTMFIDLSTVYGETEEKARKLRTFQGGRLILDEHDMLPLNTKEFDFNMVKRRGAPGDTVFAAGDVRANQDFIMQLYHTIWLREHNRICEDLIDLYPERAWTDEELYLTARTVAASKFAAVGSAYFLAYFTPSMPFPSAVSVYSEYNGLGPLPPLSMFKYPWAPALNNKTGLPNALSNEFSVAYRWHSLIPDVLQLLTEDGQQSQVNLVHSSFSAADFKKHGIENIVRGMFVTDIPHFRSGVQNSYRNIKHMDYHDPSEGHNFDLAAWAIEHERERGCPTFNEFIRKAYHGVPTIKPRETFEEFTDNATLVERLKATYSHPDEVDMLVGQELDPTYWPNTVIPTAQLAISFYTLFMGSAIDRFSLTFQILHCIIDQRPWDCQPDNVLQELLWKDAGHFLGKDWKTIDGRWLHELDVEGEGVNMLRTVISRNTGVKCMPKNAFFKLDPASNPETCWNLTAMPGPTGLAGSPALLLVELLADGQTTLKFYEKLQNKYGYVVHYRLPMPPNLSQPVDYVLLTRANPLPHIFNSSDFLRRMGPTYVPTTLGRLAGGYKDGRPLTGITMATGKMWENRRGIVNAKIIPQFPSYMPRLHAYATKFTLVLATHAGNANYQPFADVERSVFEAFGEFAIGAPFTSLPEAQRAQLFGWFVIWLNDFPNDMLIPLRKTLKDALDGLYAFLSKTLADRRKAHNWGEDWLSQFATTPLPDGTHLDDAAVLACTFELWAGGWAPTSFQLTATLNMLGLNKLLLGTLQAVVDALPRDFTIADLHRAPLLLNVIKESLRYNPGAGHLGSRSSVEGSQPIVEGFQIPPSTVFLYNVQAIQRSQRYYTNPNVFDPDRWNGPAPRDGAYIPFGGGAMGCAGQNLANLELVVAVAHVVRYFNIKATAEPVVNMNFVASFQQPAVVEFELRRSLHDEL